MRQIVFEYENQGIVETFSPDWFLLSLNPDTKVATLIDKTTFRKRKFLYSHEVINPDGIRITVLVATLIDKTTFRKRKFLYSHEVINPDGIRITVLEELVEKGGEVPPQPNNKNLAMEGTTNA